MLLLNVQELSTAGVKRISWLHAARRVQQVGLVLAKHGFGGVVESMGVFVPRLPDAPAPSSRERLARRLADTLT